MDVDKLKSNKIRSINKNINADKFLNKNNVEGNR